MLKPSSFSTLGFCKVCADEGRCFAWRDRENNRSLDILAGNLLEFLIEEANQPAGQDRLKWISPERV